MARVRSARARLTGRRSRLAPSGLARSGLARCRLAFVLAAAAASVAGCVGMPNSGSPGTVGATQQDTTQDSDFIGAIPAGPQKGWSPTDIVRGFLNASIGYPVYQDIANEYLATPAKQLWGSGWSVKVVDRVSVPTDAYYSQGSRIATVDVTGLVQASFNGSGQYVGAPQGRSAGQQDGSGAQPANQKFTLAKVNGEWRITNAPEFGFRMMTQDDFVKVYRAQDLYFFDPTDQVLVPDAVFVPAGTSPTSLVGNLVNALLVSPQPVWLQAPSGQTPPAVTAFPLHTKLNNVMVDGSTATVDLGGAAVSATSAQRQLMATQLVWTLTGQAPNRPNVQNPPNIQAVQMEINGKPWTSSTAACPDTGGPGQSPAQKLLMYRCKNPYPTATSSAFYYTAGGQAWTRCASQSQVMAGNVGVVQAVFGKTGAASLKPSCQDSVQASAQPVPPPQTRPGPALTMFAVSPDGKYLAGYSPDGKSLDMWAANQAKPTTTKPLSGVTSIVWDRRDYLWVAQGNATTVIVPTTGGSKNASIGNDFPGKVLGLGIAPDGVRVAAIVQTDPGSPPEVELAAINSGTPTAGQLSAPFDRMSIGQTVQLGPNVTNPVALTWYDADDLLVIGGTGSQTSLWEVPVDGQPAKALPGLPPGAISITANSTQNVLVAGLTNNRMVVSAGLAGPWQPLGIGGQNPIFQTPFAESAPS
jgi:Lipoprotein LpqB beta-propeller domain/Sporulation and spore germination